MDDSKHIYSDKFFHYISEGSRKSASAVAKIIEPLFANDEGTVLDVGCGQGVWTREFVAINGVRNATGIDGKYVNQKKLVIPANDFIAHDLTTPLQLGRRFTISISLEVGEHLPKEAAPILVQTLVDHADIVLFSAAVPGQGGEFHVNEQPLEFWRDLFESYNYVPLDVIRPQLLGNRHVAPWYRYNIMLYVAKDKLAYLPATLSGTPVPADQKFQSFAPLFWKIRCAILLLLPRNIVEILAQMKHWFIRSMLRARA